MYQAALKTYDTVNKSTMSGREVEAEVLTRAALRLKECQENWGKGEKLHDALKYNQRIWTILEAEIEKTDNPLPMALKRDLLRLILFIDKRTIETLAYPSPDKLRILIEINTNIAAGLRNKPKTSHNEKAAA